MKILLSAYACEPGKGSEPAVGWNWALALMKQGHQLCVLTRSNNQDSIEAAIRRDSLSFEAAYYDLPSWCRKWKRWPGGLYFYYLFWQLGAYRYARSLHRAQHFDVVHHTTFVTFRQPSFMGRLGIPFIFGPVGGGETSPALLRKGLNGSGRVREAVRSSLVAIAAFDPLMNQTFRSATLIACTTAETLAKIPARFRSRCIVLPAIGIDIPAASTLTPQQPDEPASEADLRPAPAFLFVGRLLYWKGLHLVLRALPEVLRHLPEARLKVVGEGADAAWLRSVAEEAGVAAHVDWVPQLPHDDIASAYNDHTAFVFPSLHDSGGLVVLESLAAGLPVICLALGGPGVFVDGSCGVVIDPAERSEKQIEQQLAAAMISLAEDPQLRQSLADHCVGRARRFSWEHGAQELYASFARVAEQAPKHR